MQSQQFRIVYLERKFYVALQSKTSTLGELLGLFTGNSQKSNLSPLTVDVVRRVNELCESALGTATYFPDLVECGKISFTRTADNNYAKEATTAFLESVGVESEEVKFYEIVPWVSGNDKLLLVVVAEGFLKSVTDSKEGLRDFYLQVLRHLYAQNADMRNVMRKYLDLGLNRGFLDLVKLGLNRHYV